MALVYGQHWQIYDHRGRRKYLTASERDRFLAQADRCTTPRRALLYLLAFSGCRVSEALSLTRQHVNVDADTVVLRTLKRRHICFREIPLPFPVVEMLMCLGSAADDRLWSVHRGTAWRWVKAAMVAADIAGPMACPRGLRHGFGTRAAGRNLPITLIQKWMGHAQPATTAIYLELVGEEERELASRLW